MINILILFLLINKCLCYILDYSSVYELGAMSYNTYLNIGNKKWVNTSLNNVIDVSLMENSIRAYLFSNDDRSKNTIAIKGTTIYFESYILGVNELSVEIFSNETLVEISSKRDNRDNVFSSSSNENNVFSSSSNESSIGLFSSSSNDKWNDNLFFSCCFNKETNIKDCLCDQSTTCCKSCYKKSLEFEKNYLNILDKIMENVRTLIDIDNVELIFTGHSLGGTLASYLGIKYNKLTVAFESPGDRHYFLLSDLVDKDKKFDNIYHFGHNADPIFMGNCGSTCSLLGYYIDTKCHIGNTCLYNAKEKLNYTESILNHRVGFILNNVIPHWKDDLPECKLDVDCIDCKDWVYT